MKIVEFEDSAKYYGCHAQIVQLDLIPPTTHNIRRNSFETLKKAKKNRAVLVGRFGNCQDKTSRTLFRVELLKLWKINGRVLRN